MKKLYLLLLSSVLFFSCGKENERIVSDDWTGSYTGSVSSTPSGITYGKPLELIQNGDQITIKANTPDWIHKDDFVAKINGNSASVGIHPMTLTDGSSPYNIWDLASWNMVKNGNKITVNYEYKTYKQTGALDIHYKVVGEFTKQ